MRSPLFIVFIFFRNSCASLASPSEAEVRSNLFAPTSPYPDAGFNYPLPSRSMLTRDGGTTQGHYENGYPVEGTWQQEEGLGNPLRWQGKQITPDWGNGQLLGVPKAPTDPPLPPKFDANDYSAGSETMSTRDYSKQPVMRDPIPAT